MNHIDLFNMCTTDLNVDFDIRYLVKYFNNLDLPLARKVLNEVNSFIGLKEQDHVILKNITEGHI